MNFLKTKSLSLNAISNWGAFGINVLLSFILTPILITKLGDENYGIWALIGSIIGMYGLLDLGLDSAILRYVSYYNGKNDKRSIDSVLTTSLIAYIFIGILIFLFSLISLDFFVNFFNVAPKNINNFKYTIIFIGSSVAITFPTNVFRTNLISFEFYIYNNIIRIVTEVIRVTSIIFILNIGYGIREVALITLLMAIVNFIIYFTISNVLNKVHLNISLYSPKILKKLLLFGFPALITILAHLLRVQVDSIVIAKWMDFSSVTLYNVSVKLTMFLTQFIMAISAVLDPRFGSLLGMKDYTRIKKIFYESSTIIATLTFSVGFSLLIFGKSLLNLWVGSSYMGSYIILCILATGQMMACIQMPLISLLFALNNHRIVAVISIAEGIFNLTLSIILVHYFGIIGVATGTLIPIMIRLPFMFIYIIKKCNYINIDSELIILIIKPISIISLISIIIIFFSSSIIIDSWLILGLAFITMVIFFLLINYFTTIPKEHKDSLIAVYNNLIKKNNMEI